MGRVSEGSASQQRHRDWGDAFVRCWKGFRFVYYYRTLFADLFSVLKKTGNIHMTTAEIDGQKVDDQAFRAYEYSLSVGSIIYATIQSWLAIPARSRRISTHKATMASLASDPTKAAKSTRNWTATPATRCSPEYSARTKRQTTILHSCSTGRAIPQTPSLANSLYPKLCQGSRTSRLCPSLMLIQSTVSYRQAS